MLCIIEAKEDDFEQGLAQCLVEMQACQWKNQQANHSIDVMGIVTNGEGWKFYKLIPEGSVYETPAYSIGDLNLLLERLHHVFQACEWNLDMAKDLDAAGNSSGRGCKVEDHYHAGSIAPVPSFMFERIVKNETLSRLPSPHFPATPQGQNHGVFIRDN